jgi:Arc/MetJ family transcription regulator
MNTRTNIVLDDNLVAKAMARAGVKTKKAAVEAALRAFVREPDYSGLLALAGTGVIADDYDPKATFTHPRYRSDMASERGTAKRVARSKRSR